MTNEIEYILFNLNLIIFANYFSKNKGLCDKAMQFIYFTVFTRSRSYRFIPDAKDILFLSLILFERKYEKAF